MIFEKLTIQNFLSIKHIELDLKDRGLVLLQGCNKDNESLSNNGTGKSSIIEALVYAIYARTLRGLKGDAVVHRIPNKNMKIWLDLEDDNGDKYRIARYRKHSQNKNKSFLFLNGKDITPKSEADFNDAVADLLQADYVTFTSSILYSAESFKFTSATDAEMKATFDNMLGLDVYQKCLEITRNRLKSLELELSTTESRISDKAQRIEELEQQITDAKTDHEKWLAEIEQSKQSIKSAKEKALLEKKEQLDLQTKYQDELNDANSEYVVAEDKLEQAKKDCENIEALKEVIQEHKEQLSDLQLKLKKRNSFIASNREEIDDQVDRIEKCTSKIDVLKAKQSELDSTIGQPCPTCGQPLTAEAIEPAKKEYDTKIAEQLERIEKYKAKKSELSKEIEEWSETVKTLQSQIDSTTATIDEYTALVEKSKGIIDKKKQAENSLQEIRNRISQAQMRIKNTESMIGMINTNIANYDTQLENVGKTNPYESLIEKAESSIELCKSDMETLTNSIKEKSGEKDCLLFWQTAYSNSGIKSLVLDDITPFLNKRANKYLSKLTSGHIEVNFTTSTTLKSGEKREKFAIEIKNADGGQEYSSNSGGEKKRIDLAINLALQDLVASRSTKKINIAIWDEAFDALDDTGIESVMELLNDLQNEKSTIIVISHNEHLKSYLTNTITVVKENGFSRLANAKDLEEEDEE